MGPATVAEWGAYLTGFAAVIAVVIGAVNGLRSGQRRASDYHRPAQDGTAAAILEELREQNKLLLEMKVTLAAILNAKIGK